MFTVVLISRCDYFGFGLTTFNQKALFEITETKEERRLAVMDWDKKKSPKKRREICFSFPLTLVATIFVALP